MRKESARYVGSVDLKMTIHGLKKFSRIIMERQASTLKSGYSTNELVKAGCLAV
jgi:hypothetical protein